MGRAEGSIGLPEWARFGHAYFVTPRHRRTSPNFLELIVTLIVTLGRTNNNKAHNSFKLRAFERWRPHGDSKVSPASEAKSL